MTEVIKSVLNSLAPERPDHPLSPPSSAIALPSFLRRLWSFVGSEGLLPVKGHARQQTRETLTMPQRRTSFVQCPATTADAHDIGQVTIDMLPDVVLLELFDFYVHEIKETNRWMTLVRVCQRWRNIVFGSPLRLDLRLVCTNVTPVRRTLNVWPPLPIVIKRYFDSTLDIDNILAALEHNNRICKIILTNIPSAQLEKVITDAGAIPGTDISGASFGTYR